MQRLLCALLLTNFIWQVKCRGTWNASGQYEYYVSPGEDSRPYVEAQAYCNEQGGELALVKTQVIQQFIQTFVTDTGTSGSPYGFFIGLRDIGSNGTFIWNDGEALIYKNWMTGEPNKIETEPCVVMGWIYTYAANLPWYDVNCTTGKGGPRGFVCQRSKPSTTTETDISSKSTVEVSTRTSGYTKDSTSPPASTIIGTTKISATSTVGVSTVTSGYTTDNRTPSPSNIIIIAASVSAVIVILLIIGIVIFCKRRNKNNDSLNGIELPDQNPQNPEALDGEINPAYMADIQATSSVQETYAVINKKPTTKKIRVKESEGQGEAVVKDTNSSLNQKSAKLNNAGQETYSVVNKPDKGSKNSGGFLNQPDLEATYSSLNREGSNVNAADTTYSSLGVNDAAYNMVNEGQETYSVVNQPDKGSKNSGEFLNQPDLEATYSSLNREGSNVNAADTTYSSLGVNDAAYNMVNAGQETYSVVNQPDKAKNSGGFLNQHELGETYSSLDREGYSSLGENEATYSIATPIRSLSNVNGAGASNQMGEGDTGNYSVINDGSAETQQSDIYSTLNI